MNYVFLGWRGGGYGGGGLRGGGGVGGGVVLARERFWGIMSESDRV